MTGRAREVSAASTTWRTIGSPSSVATSFVSSTPPAARKRDDRPAARTIAATLLMRLARLRARGDLHQEAADAHGADVGGRTSAPRRSAAAGPSRSRFPSASARSPARRGSPPRRAWRAAAGCRDRPACRTARSAPDRLDRGRDHVAPVGDRGGAEDDDESVGARRETPARRQEAPIRAASSRARRCAPRSARAAPPARAASWRRRSP